MAKLLYQGHGSLRLITDSGAVFYIDPYVGSGYDIEADAIFVTHEHPDHNAVGLPAKKESTVIYRAKDFLSHKKYEQKIINGVLVKAVPAYNRNHPRGKCVGFVMETDGIKIYFAGDTSTTDAMPTLLHDEKLDYAFCPIDGIFNMDADEAGRCADMVGAKHNIPIHMAPGRLFDKAIADKFNCEGRMILKPGEEITL